MPETKLYTHRKEYPQEARRREAAEVTLAALQALETTGRVGDKFEVVKGTGGKVHVKTYRRGF